MIKNEIAPGIMSYIDVLDDSLALIEQIELACSNSLLKWEGASVKNGDKVEVDYTTRDTLAIGIPYKFIPPRSQEYKDANSNLETIGTLSKQFFNAMDPIEKDYQSNYGVNLQWHDAYSILKYGVGQKFTNHIDDHKDYIRRLSAVFYLNDDYEGGEINFPRFNLSHKPKANELILFPSNYMYNHSVSPVISGTRYAIVSWMR